MLELSLSLYELTRYSAHERLIFSRRLRAKACAKLHVMKQLQKDQVAGKCWKVDLQEDLACKHITGVGGWCVMERLSITSSHEDQTPTVMTNRPALKGHHVNQTKSKGHERWALWVCDPKQNSFDLEHIIRDNGEEIHLAGCNGNRLSA